MDASFYCVDAPRDSALSHRRKPQPIPKMRSTPNTQQSSNPRPDSLRCLEVPDSKSTVCDELESNVWIADPDVAYRLVKVVERRDDKFVIGFRDDSGFYEKRSVSIEDTQAPSLNYFCEDLCDLSELTDANVLHAIRCRYEEKLIHTYSGLFCVVVNPWKNLPLYTESVMYEYANALDRGNSLPPHVYTVAQCAYDGLSSGSNQSILITGESGAGKTENTKRIIEYLGFEADKRSGVERNGNSAHKRLEAANMIIESFANASTVHNSNSSRVGKFIRIDFGDDLQLSAAQIQCYLLEKSRVVSQNEGDRNFHIFYQLLSEGFAEKTRCAMGIGMRAEAYRFLSQGGKTTDSDIDDVKCSAATEHALDVIGFTEEEKMQIYETLAACILLGEIKFNERSGLDITYVDGSKEVEAACRLLGVKTSHLIAALTSPSMKVGQTFINKSQNLRKTLSSLSGLCKCIYERLFNFIVERCNQTLGKSFSLESSSRTNYIGVLDMAGFEVMKKNSFEQFCINYTNEKLQQFFNDFMFIREQKEYIREGIDWEQVDYGNDMQNTIELIEKPLGLLSLLQEECVVPNGSDKSLLEKLLTNHSSNPVFSRSKQSARRTTVAHFCVVHYAGAVQYNIDGWVEKNKDNVERCGLQVLSESRKPIFKTLFPKQQDEMTRSRRQSLCASTVTYMYKEQLLNLLETLNTTRAQFVRCVSPNDRRQPNLIDPHLVLHQLRCNGVLEGVRICRQGYPNRLPFDEFVGRYKLLASNCDCDHDRDGASSLCIALHLDPTITQIGTTKVFCKVGVISELENRRRDRLGVIVSNIQATVRWYFEQKEYRRKLEERESVLIIQKNVRNYAELSTWPWYRLFGLARQLIPLSKDKERIEELEKENDDLFMELTETQEHYSDLERQLEEARRRIGILEREKKERESEKEELRSEMFRNEEVLAIMEKRFDEQHSKVMMIHNNLRENEKKLEHVEAEKINLEDQLLKWKEKYQREYVQRKVAEERYTEHELVFNALQKKFDVVVEERQKRDADVQRLGVEVDELNAKNDQQRKIIIDLQQMMCDLKDKTRDVDALVSAEKKTRRQAENERADKEAELDRLQERMQKMDVKMNNFKESCRDKDKQIKKLQTKLDESVENAEVSISELKRIHKQSKNTLEDRVDELKKTVQKLETENRTQKIKLDSTDRESSVESDYVSGRTSRLGSRQYSLTSMSSFSSIRTLSTRRTTEPDLKHYGMRSPSSLSSSYYRPSDSYSLSRSNSQSQLGNERKIAQLERQILSAHTDIEIQKREIEVYKTSLAENEKERGALTQKVQKMALETNDLERSTSNQDRKCHEFELRMRKAQDELSVLREKHESYIKDSQDELVEEKKKMRAKMDELVQEQERLRVPRYATLEKTLEETQEQLSETRSQLDLAMTQVTHLENLSKSQGAYGETWENQYRMALVELESLRDENLTLKTKLRRQHKQIELLTHQSDIEADVASLEERLGVKKEVCNGDDRGLRAEA